MRAPQITHLMWWTRKSLMSLHNPPMLTTKANQRPNEGMCWPRSRPHRQAPGGRPGAGGGGKTGRAAVSTPLPLSRDFPKFLLQNPLCIVGNDAAPTVVYKFFGGFGAMRGFWERTERVWDCLIWTGPTDGFGYGRCTRRGQKGAHRVAWLLKRGEAPRTRLVNKCGNRACINPDHWREIEERVSERKRAAMEIVRLWESGMRISEIAKEVGCARSTVWRNVRGLEE